MTFFLMVAVSLLMTSSARSMSHDVVIMVVTFLKQDDRPTSLLAPQLCWPKDQMASLVKSLTHSKTTFATSLQENREDYHLEHSLLLADLSCPNSDELIKQYNDKGYFKSPFRWLLLDLQNQNYTELLDQLDILVDSDVVLVKKLGDKYDFIEVYKISSNAELIFNTRSSWYPTLPKNYKVLNDTQVLNKINQPNITTVIIRANDNAVAIHKNGIMKDYRKSKALLSRRNNLQKHTLIMANVIYESNETREHLSDVLKLHQDSVTKMSYTMAKICIDVLNATEKLLFPNSWGSKDKNGSWDGVVGHLIRKEADLGTVMLVTQQRFEVIDYIAMVDTTSLRFVFREPPLSSITNIFVLPFTAAVWIAIVVCVLGCAVFLYITSKWEASLSRNQLQLDGSWADVLILIIGAVLQQGCTLEPRFAAGRTVTLLLFLSLTILYSAYAANIVVLLRAPSPTVRTISDLLHSPLELGASDFEYNKHYFKVKNDSLRKAVYEKKIAPKGKKPHFYSMKEGVEKIRRGLFAFHMETYPGYRIMQETYQEGEKCDLVEINYLNEFDPWMPGQKRSPYKDLFKINFLKIRETGIQDCMHRRFRVSRPRCFGSVSTFSSVGITDMYPAMMATLYGAFLAPVILLLEIAYFRLTAIRKKILPKKQSITSL